MKKNKILKKAKTLLVELFFGSVQKIVVFIFIFLVSAFFFLIETKTLPSFYDNQRVYASIKKEIGEQYDVNIFTDNITGYGWQTLVVFANDKKYKDQAYVPTENEKLLQNYRLPKLLPPVVAFYEHRDSPLSKLLLFSIPYKKVFEFRPQVLNSTHDDLWIYQTNILDLDNDGKKEVVVKILSYVFGSIAEVYHLIFGFKEGAYALITTLPAIGYYPNCPPYRCDSFEGVVEHMKETKFDEKKVEWFTETRTILNLFNNKNQELYITDTDHYVEFADIDKDNFYELIFAHPEWRLKENCFKSNSFNSSECECHFCPHYWTIGVYKYKNDDFVVDNKWNRGNLFKTKSKISLTQALGYVEVPNNIAGFIGQYSLDKASPYFNIGMDSFYTKSRREPEIYKIVKKHYSK